jgi:hypothetical protein
LTFVREAYLGQLLSVTRTLKTLRWAWYHHPDLEDQFNTPIIDLGQIVAVISRVRGTLTDLTISAVCYSGQGDLKPPPLKTKGSLNAIVNFDMLKRFEAPLHS